MSEEELRLKILEMDRRLSELQDAFAFHQGINSAQASIYAPHPNISIDTGEFGGGVMRLNRYGIQLESDNVDRPAIYGVSEFTTGNPEDLDAYSMLKMRTSSTTASASLVAKTENQLVRWEVAAGESLDGAYASVSDGFFRLHTTEVPITISGGVITPTGNRHALTSETSTSDTLTDIADAPFGGIPLLLRSSAGHTITITDSGNIVTPDGEDVVLDSYSSYALFMSLGSEWHLISTNVGGSGGGALTWNTVDSAVGTSSTSAIGDKPSLRDDFTLTNPGTSPDNVFSITGSGEVLYLAVAKPATTNNVSVNMTLVVDGVTIVNNSPVTSSATSVRSTVIVGQNVRTTNNDTGALYHIPFHTGISVSFGYSSNPGASEDITGSFVVSYE